MQENEDLNVEQLFSDVSKALREGKPEVISELVKAPVEENKVEPETKPGETTAEAVETKDTTQTTTTETTGKEKKPPETTKSNDWTETLPEDVREKVRSALQKESEATKYYQQRYRSDIGRQEAYQKQIKKLTDIIEELKSKPLANEIAAAQVKQDEDFDTLAENDPKFASFLKRREQELEKRISEAFDQRFTKLLDAQKEQKRQELDTEQQSYVQEQQRLLRDLVPNVDYVVKTDAWKHWITNVATDSQRGLAGSPHAQDGYAALELYAGWLHKTGVIQPQATKETPPAAPAKPTQVDTSEADRIASERNKRGVSATAVSGGSTPTKVSAAGQDVDLEALFSKIYNEKHPNLNRGK